MGSSRTSKLANSELNLSLFKTGCSLYDGIVLGSIPVWFNANDSLWFFFALNKALAPEVQLALRKSEGELFSLLVS